MPLRTCTWEKSGPRCEWPAEVQRAIPGRERLKTYPVCLWHSAMIDIRQVDGDDPVDEHRPDDFVRTSAMLLDEAEQVVIEAGRDRP